MNLWVDGFTVKLVALNYMYMYDIACVASIHVRLYRYQLLVMHCNLATIHGNVNNNNSSIKLSQ